VLGRAIAQRVHKYACWLWRAQNVSENDPVVPNRSHRKNGSPLELFGSKPTPDRKESSASDIACVVSNVGLTRQFTPPYPGPKNHFRGSTSEISTFDSFKSSATFVCLLA